jgi:circadian clock protein KaiC
MYRSPVDIYIDEWVHDLLRVVDHTQARRVVIDGLMDLQMASLDDTRFREFMYSLVQRFSRHGINLLSTCEMPDLFSAGNLSAFAWSQLADNVIMLNYHSDHACWRRSLAVVKARASRHDNSIRQVSIGPGGMTVGGIADGGQNPVNGQRGGTAPTGPPTHDSNETR